MADWLMIRVLAAIETEKVLNFRKSEMHEYTHQAAAAASSSSLRRMAMCDRNDDEVSDFMGRGIERSTRFPIGVAPDVHAAALTPGPSASGRLHPQQFTPVPQQALLHPQQHWGAAAPGNGGCPLGLTGPAAYSSLANHQQQHNDRMRYQQPPPPVTTGPRLASSLDHSKTTFAGSAIAAIAAAAVDGYNQAHHQQQQHHLQQQHYQQQHYLPAHPPQPPPPQQMVHPRPTQQILDRGFEVRMDEFPSLSNTYDHRSDDARQQNRRQQQHTYAATHQHNNNQSQQQFVTSSSTSRSYLGCGGVVGSNNNAIVCGGGQMGFAPPASLHLSSGSCTSSSAGSCRHLGGANGIGGNRQLISSSSDADYAQIASRSPYGTASLVELLCIIMRKPHVSLKVDISSIPSFVVDMDLTKLGIKISQTDVLHTGFHSPFDKNSGAVHRTEQHVPNEYRIYKNVRTRLCPLALSKCAEDSLLYMFFNMNGDYLQPLAAKELIRRGWMYLPSERTWFSRIPNSEPLNKTHACEYGQFHVFDLSSWRKIKKEIYVEFEKLENFNEDVNRNSLAKPLSSSSQKPAELDDNEKKAQSEPTANHNGQPKNYQHKQKRIFYSDTQQPHHHQQQPTPGADSPSADL